MCKITPLWLAAKQGLLTVVSQLAAHGADVNYRASDGSTALHNAVLDYNINVVRLLVGRLIIVRSLIYENASFGIFTFNASRDLG